MVQSKDVDGDDMERYGIRFLVDSTNFGLVNTNLPGRMELERGLRRTKSFEKHELRHSRG